MERTGGREIFEDHIICQVRAVGVPAGSMTGLLQQQQQQQ